jgi:hypothetical protein
MPGERAEKFQVSSEQIERMKQTQGGLRPIASASFDFG